MLILVFRFSVFTHIWGVKEGSTCPTHNIRFKTLNFPVGFLFLSWDRSVCASCILKPVPQSGLLSLPNDATLLSLWNALLFLITLFVLRSTLSDIGM